MTRVDRPFRSKVAPTVGGGSAAPSGPAGGDLSGTYPNPSVVAASATAAGKVELATSAETTTGTDTVRATTPAGVAAALSAYAQPLDSDLTAIAALSTTSYGRALLTLANQAALTAALANGTETLPGILELATQAETNTGTDDARAVSPLKLATRLSAYAQPLDSDLTAVAALTTTTYGRAFLELANQAALMGLLSAASTTASGIVELATSAETITGTDTVRAVTPAGAAAAFQPLDADLTAFAGKTAPTGAVVGTTDTQALTNKDLTGVGNTFPTLNQNTTGSAAKWTTGRTLGITGDLVYTSPAWDGSANVTAAGTLATVNSNVGTFGSATQAVTVTVDAKGRVTGIANTSIQIAESQVTGLATDLASLQSGLALVSNGTITGTGVITGPTFRTAASGARWELQSSPSKTLRGYTGNAQEGVPGQLDMDSSVAGTVNLLYTNLYSPQSAGGERSLVQLYARRDTSLPSADYSGVNLLADNISITGGTSGNGVIYINNLGQVGVTGDLAISGHLTTTGTGWLRPGAAGGPTWGTGWTDFGGGNELVAMKRVGNTVRVVGLAKRTSGSSTTVMTLPAGCRPVSGTTARNSAFGERQGVLYVNTTGTVVLSGTGAYVTNESLLIDITFDIDQP